MKNNKHKNSPRNIVNDWTKGWSKERDLPSEPTAWSWSAHLKPETHYVREIYIIYICINSIVQVINIIGTKKEFNEY